MSKTNKRNQVIKLLMGKGYTLNQSKGIVANLIRESSLDTGAHNPKDPGHKGSRGLAQWNRERLERLQSMYGDGWTKLENQVDYIHWELQNTHKHVGKKLKNTNTVEDAVRLITKEYEIPANMDREIQERLKIAKSFTDISEDNFDLEVDYYQEGVEEPSVVNTIRERVAIGDPTFNYQTNMGIINSAPDMSDEDKSEISKIAILQKQLEDIQQQINTQPAPEETDNSVRPNITEPVIETPNYLANNELFTIHTELPEIKRGGRF